MNGAEEDKIISRIRKLMALGESPNQFEAETALKTAERLMLLYKVEMNKVKDHRDAGKFQELCVAKFLRMFPEVDFAASICTNFYFVRLLIRIRRDSLIPNTRTKKQYIFFGREKDLEMAQFVFNFTCEAMKIAWLEFKREYGRVGTGGRRAFYQGFYIGLARKLRNERKSVEKECVEVVAIVRADNTELKARFEEVYPDLKTHTASSSYGDDDAALSEGYEAGLRANIARPIDKEEAAAALMEG